MSSRRPPLRTGPPYVPAPAFSDSSEQESDDGDVRMAAAATTTASSAAAADARPLEFGTLNRPTRKLQRASRNDHEQQAAPPVRVSRMLVLPMYMQRLLVHHSRRTVLSGGASGDRETAATASPSPPLKLPSAWSQKEKSSHLELSKQAMRVSYNGPGKTDADAASVRSNEALPVREPGVFYYEVTIVSKGRDGYIGIGLAGAGVSLNRLPGWEQQSWGYHGDDGNAFNCSGTGHPFGPTFTTGDVIGCGFLAYRDHGAVFYTKNGKFLGFAFKNVLTVLSKPTSSREQLSGTVAPRPLYACVGLRTPNEVVEVNFGQTVQRPFVFNVEQFMEDERADFAQRELAGVAIGELGNDEALSMLKHHRRPYDGSEDSMDIAQTAESLSPRQPIIAESTAVNAIILNHLLHRTFFESAFVFAQNVGNELPSSAANHSIEHLIMTWVPAAANPPPAIIELMYKLKHSVLRHHIHQSILSGHIAQAIQQIQQAFGASTDWSSWPVFRLRCRQFVEIVRSQATPTSPAWLQEALKFGQQLQSEYMNDKRPAVARHLVETFALLAYADPAQCPPEIACLLKDDAREEIADLVNDDLAERALAGQSLATQAHHAMPHVVGSTLTRTWQQTQVILTYLSEQGVSEACLLDLDRDLAVVP